MEINRALLYLIDNSDQRIFPLAIQICKFFNCQLFVLFVLEEHRVSKLASLTRENTKVIRQRMEEEGWEMLYLVEDEAVENGVRTSLHLENGLAINVIRKYVENYKIDLILIRRREETKKVFVASPAPVMGL
uniref:Universal stress protein n=1 Tax=candidate division WOR-3 bacterium TaxID=2052148 RepID=A0A7C4TB69_UNCW3